MISEIIGADLEKSRLVERFILQPRNGQGKLRYWLFKNNFVIEKELLVREGKFICEVLVATAGAPPNAGNVRICGEPGSLRGEEKGKECAPDDIRFEVPARLIKENGVLGLEFAKRRLMIEKQILSDIEKNGSSALEKKERQIGRIAYLSELL